MILKTTNHKYHIDEDRRSTYDIVDENNTKFFTVETIEVEGYRYQELCCTDTKIDKITAHFDTKGESASVVLNRMITESTKIVQHKLHLLNLKNKRLKREMDPTWKEVCQSARILTKNNLKNQARQLVLDYLQKQK